MKLRVICQRCERTATIDTHSRAEWLFSRINDVVYELPDRIDWEFWLCPNCVVLADESYNNETYEDFFADLLEIEERDYRGK